MRLATYDNGRGPRPALQQREDSELIDIGALAALSPLLALYVRDAYILSHDGAALVGIVTFGSLAGSMLPFALKRLGFDPASASAPFVATLVDVTGLIIYFSVAYVILKGTLL